MSDLVFLPAHQLAAMIRDREVSAVEVLEAHLKQIAHHNLSLNAIVTLDAQGAMQRAKAADEALARGELWGPLHGVPVTVKDYLATVGLRTTCAHASLANYIPDQDATSVARLRSAGAILLGKTNLPTLALGIQTDSDLLGRANNPWNLNYTPGGSSGGGAAAIAAGLSPLELGGDGGGSIRIPAHFCGVFGLKPTLHRVSYQGVVLGLAESRGWREMAVIGPLARSVADLRLCLSVIEGADPRAWEIPPAPVETLQQRPLKQYRFAWTDDLGGVPLTQETQAAIHKLVSTLEQLGCQVEHRNPPGFDFEQAAETFGEIVGSESIAVQSPLERLQLQMVALLPFVKSAGRVVRGFAKAARLNMPDYFAALTRRDTLATTLEQFLSGWDAWICPVTPGSAFAHRQMINPALVSPLSVDGRELPYWVWGVSFTALFNLTGHPVVVLPIGRTQSGLPIGVQLVGKRWQDQALLAIAEALTEVTGPFQRPPGY